MSNAESLPAAATHNRFHLALAMGVATVANAAVIVIMKLAPRWLGKTLGDSTLLNAVRLPLAAVLLGIGVFALCRRLPRIRITRLGLHFIAVASATGLVGVALAQGLLFSGLQAQHITSSTVLLLEAIVPGIALVFVCTKWSDLGVDLLLWTTTVVLFVLSLYLGKIPPDVVRLNSYGGMLLGSVVCTTAGLFMQAYAFPAKTSGSALHQDLFRTFAVTLFAATGSAIFAWWQVGRQVSASLPLIPRAGWEGFACVVISLAVIGSCVGWLAIFYLFRYDPMLVCISLMLSPLLGWVADWVDGLNGSSVFQFNVGATICFLAVILTALAITRRRFVRIQVC